MGNRYLKTIGTVGTLFIFSLAFGQKIQQPVPNFESPFQKKTSSSQQATLAPTRSGDFVGKKPKGSIENYNIVHSNDYSVITFSENSRIIASDFFQILKSDLGLSESDNFKLIKTENDEIGFVHYRYQQIYNDIPVFGSEYLLHEKSNKLSAANGTFYKISLNISPSVSKESAIQAAIQSVGAEKYLWDNAAEEQFLKTEKNDQNATYLPQADLVIAPKNGNYGVKDFRLCYKVFIASEKPYNLVNVFVDAHTGEIINTIDKIAHADVTGTGSTLYSGTKGITMDSYNGAYRLRETGRPIQTFNMNGGTNYSAATDFTNASTSWGSVPSLNSFTISNVALSWWYTSFADEIPDLYIVVKDGSGNAVYTSSDYYNTNAPVTFNNLNITLGNPPYSVEVWDYDAANSDDFGGSYSISTSAGTFNWSGSGNSGSYNSGLSGRAEVEVHWAMEKTYDFYLNQLNRNSYDNAGSIIKNYIHYDLAYDNAFWNGVAMTYGDGSGDPFTPLVSIDVVGHEFSHAVVEYTAGLQYQAESGALNESFADIFGTAIEFDGATSPNWTMGELITVSPNTNLRSMSNPNNPTGLAQQPDTYNGTFWQNTANINDDHGGVHTNSGVQNFWYYLLSEGGSGTNDLGNAYSVAAIGINQATQIAYRNLSFYLTSNSNYMEAYYGSLLATEDLYGSQSTQYTAVQQAWYAVGIGNLSSNFCGGTTYLTAPSGTITDGSGSSNYYDNSNCMWVITPPGATQIQLLFSEFDTEADYDTVFVYDGPDETFPILATWWGNTLPPAITTSPGVGAMCVRFSSDVTQTANGWVANYQAYGISPTCDGGTILSTPTGSFNDGSLAGNYGNNQECYWFISPPCANSVTLTFSSFNTETDYDGVAIYDGWDNNATLLAYYSGSTIPPAVTSFSGEILVVFTSDFMISNPGFTANYTSTGSAYCSGTTNLNTADYASFSDGSGTNNYCNNQDCKWLIQPPQATSVTLNFTEFDIEQSSIDGDFYDAVEVYDGTSTSAPLLGRFAGNNLPPAITSTGGSMFVRFVSDISENFQGFSAYYTSTQNSYCSGVTTTLTGLSGSFADGSSANSYANNTNCSWLIQPTNVSSITLSFPTFNTELNYDGVIVYDGPNNTSPILGQFSGSSIPASLTSTGGSMYVEFLSDPSVRAPGWSANYTSTLISGISFETEENNFELYPNPTQSDLNVLVNSSLIGSDLCIFDAFGKLLYKAKILSTRTSIPVSNFADGNYILRVGELVKRFVVEK